MVLRKRLTAEGGRGAESATDNALDLVVRGGMVVNVDGMKRADVGVRAGVVVDVGRPGTVGPARFVIDASEQMVVPGGVDAHVHADDTVGDFRTRDSFYECSLAALAGGTTTIVDFAMPLRAGGSPWDAAQARVETAASSAIDVALHGGISSADRASLDAIPRLVEAGITTFKVFTVFDDVAVHLDDMAPIFEAISRSGGLALIHAEAPELIESRQRRLLDRGLGAARWHPVSRPPRSEVSMVESVIAALAQTGCPAYFVHLSTPQAVALVTAARRSGMSTWAETCPHYVLLDDRVYRSDLAHLFTCSPPLRKPRRSAELWHRLLGGEIQLWSSDHCAYDRAQKCAGSSFREIPQGLPGVETRCRLLYSEGVVRGGMMPEQFVALTSANPARLNGLYPRKGRIAVGADADLAVWNPDARGGKVSAAALSTPVDYTPFEGFELAGELTAVIRGGTIVMGPNAVDPPPVGSGRFLRADRPTLGLPA